MITAKGYRRLRHNGRLMMEHRIVWEDHNGPVPDGMQIHHINGDKLDNRIENLSIVDATTHKRIHGGCELRGDVWWKPCQTCGRVLPVDAEHWYFTREGWPNYGRCRECRITQVVELKKKKRLPSSFPRKCR